MESLFTNKNLNCNFLFNNIRSVPKNFESFKINVLNFIIGQLNFLGLCETRLTSDLEDLYILDGFTQFTNNNSRKKGGVVLYGRSDLNCKKIPELCIMEPHLESVFVEYSIKGARYSCGVIYRRPGTNCQVFLTDLTNLQIENAIN